MTLWPEGIWQLKTWAGRPPLCWFLNLVPWRPLLNSDHPQAYILTSRVAWQLLLFLDLLSGYLCALKLSILMSDSPLPHPHLFKGKERRMEGKEGEKEGRRKMVEGSLLQGSKALPPPYPITSCLWSFPVSPLKSAMQKVLSFSATICPIPAQTQQSCTAANSRSGKTPRLPG
jgi:hypothetical protein